MSKVLKRTFLLAMLSVLTVFVVIFCDAQISKDKYTTYANPTTDLLSDEKQAEQAGSLVQDAIESLFANEEGIVDIAEIFKGLFSGIGMVNSGITFLKLTGIMKDATAEALANIQSQLSTISDRLELMDAKLEKIIKKMEEIRAEQDFIDRTTSARDYRSYYRDFKTDYCTKALKPLITQFEAMQINAMKGWYNAETSDLRQGEIDNSQIILIYDYLEDEEKYDVRFTMSNALPTEDGSRYIKFSSDFLPLKGDVAAWDANDFRKEITDFVKDKINSIPTQLEFSSNFPDLTEAVINQTVEDLVNLLIYRTTAVLINDDASYPLAVLDAFDNYAENLNNSEVGYAAIVKALYYTHAFEFEVSDLINELCAESIFETAYYGSFVRDVLAMSKDVTNTKRAEFDTNYCKTINKLEDTRSKSISGKPNYCYITNTVLYYGSVDVKASAKIEHYEKSGVSGYMSYSGKGFEVSIQRYDENSNKVGSYGKNQMIGDHAATLLSMTLRSNGIVANNAYLAEKLSGAKNVTDKGVVLVDILGETELPFDSTFSMKVKKVIGDYFSDGSDVSMRYLPSKTSTSYVQWHKRLQASMFDFVNSSLSSEATVAGIGVYGESHWFWNTDEATFMSGSTSKIVSRDYNKRTVTHKDADKMVYVTDFDFSTTYNCILQEALAPNLQNEDDKVNPLYSFREETNYIDPAPAEAFPPASESSAVVKEDPEEELQKAILLIPSVYRAIIIIPCVIVGLGIAGLTAFLIIYYRKNKKKPENQEKEIK